MGKSSKAPEYAKTSYDTGGLFGSSTTDKKGTTFNPTDNMSNVANSAWQGWGNSLNAIGNNDYSSDPNFQVYQDNFNRNLGKSYQANVLNPLTQQGLMRSSGLQAATNSFNDTMADNLADLYDSYYNRQSNNLSQYQNSLNSLYNMLTGVNSGSQQNSQNVSDYNMKKWQQEQAQKQAMWSNIAQIGATVAGVAAAPFTGGASLALTPALSKAAGGLAGSTATYA